MTADEIRVGMSKGTYLGLLIAWTVFVAITMVAAVRTSNVRYAVLTVLLASPIARLFVALTAESAWESPLQVFSPLKQSWQFLFGDLFLAFSLGMFALAWRKLPPSPHWPHSWWWPAVSFAIGFLAGLSFHLSERRAYGTEADSALYSASKLLHDFSTYTLLFGGLVFAGVPLFLRAINGNKWYVHFLLSDPVHFWIGLGGIVVWVVFGALDGGMFGLIKLNPSELHPKTIWR